MKRIFLKDFAAHESDFMQNIYRQTGLPPSMLNKSFYLNSAINPKKLRSDHLTFRPFFGLEDEMEPGDEIAALKDEVERLKRKVVTTKFWEDMSHKEASRKIDAWKEIAALKAENVKLRDENNMLLAKKNWLRRTIGMALYHIVNKQFIEAEDVLSRG